MIGRRRLGWWLRANAVALVLALVGCGRPAPAPAPGVPVAPGVAQPGTMPAVAPGPGEAAADQSEDSVGGDEPEREARVETVTIKVVTEPRRQAHVLWGRKDLGATPLEIVRPRGSGPLDLMLVAPGYLPLHTRAFTDRDDTITLRLYGENEGPSLLGYHP